MNPCKKASSRKGYEAVFKKFFGPLFDAEKRVREYGGEERWQQVSVITWLAIAAFVLMGVVDFLQHSYFSLATTAASALMLYGGLRAGKKRKNTFPIEAATFVILAGFFTAYVIYGSNDGLSVLWIIFVPFLYMTMINMRLGLVLSVYYLLLLFLTFYGPLQGLLRYDYSPMMRIRFPLLYLVDCVISLYCVRKMLLDRSDLIQAQEKLQVISFVDVNTGLQNRAAYSHYQQSADFTGMRQLAVVFIDVNGLHELNNRLGHQAGDEMLRFVGQLCVQMFPEDRVYRLGGDEFLMVIERKEQCVIQQTMDALDAKVQEAGYSIAYGLEFRREHFDLEDMVNAADNKMLGAKAEHYKKFDRRRR